MPWAGSSGAAAWPARRCDCWSITSGPTPALFRVAAYVHPDNLRSARLLERGGFTLEGRSARAIMFPNLAAEPQDALLYGMALR